MSDPDSWTEQPLIEPLTDRELEILALLAENRTNREIANTLVLSLNTVKWYARQIYGKLGVAGRREAVSRAGELGLLEPVVPAVPEPNLPAQLTPFLGRQEEMRRICQQMSGPEVRLLTVVGPGGMGKTRLAIEAASCVLENQKDPFRDGVFFVTLARVSQPALIATALAQSIGFRFYQGQERPEQQLVRYLQDKRMLLVLDNLEHLVGPEGVRLLAEILEAAPRIKMLVTARSRLNLQGEHLFPLTGLETPHQEAVAGWKRPLEEARAYSGIQLFVYSARRLRPDFELTTGNLLPIVDICLSVQGMPLGIELAAGWTAVLEPNEIATEIEHSFDILATDADNVPERQQSLRAVFDTSWRLLTVQEQQAFETLAVFEDGFDREAALYVGKVSLVTLLALVNKSWLQQAAGGRFQAHNLLSRYGQERLACDADHEAAVRDRHSQYYCEWLRQQEKGLWAAEQQAVLAAIESDIGNVHRACTWAATQGHADRLGQCVNVLGLFYFQGRTSYQIGEDILRELAAAIRSSEGWPELAAEPAQYTLVKALGWQSTLSSLAGNPEGSLDALDEAQALLESPSLVDKDTSLERAHIAWQSGYLALYTDPAAARQRFAESLELYRAIDSTWGIAAAMLGLGRAVRGVNALEEARQILETSLSLHREMGNRHGESETLATLGGLAIRQAKFEEAERLIEEGLSITPETDRYGIAFALGFLGSARLHTGRFAEAEAPLKKCIAIHKELGMRTFRLHWRVYLGRAYLHAGRYRAARTQAELLVSRGHTLGYDRGIRLGRELFGEVALVKGAFALAEQYLQEARRIQEGAVESEHEPGQWVWLGLAARGPERRVEAWQHLATGLEMARESHEFMHLMVALAGTSLLLAEEDKVEEATDLFGLASRYPLVANSQWFADVVGRHIAAAAARLPPAVAHAAHERGQARDLDETVLELLDARAEWPGSADS